MPPRYTCDACGARYAGRGAALLCCSDRHNDDDDPYPLASPAGTPPDVWDARYRNKEVTHDVF